uniref:Uncharacterized protein n=1 Tax=Meloidogyne floridensis TaxID=298350 RepID=A0A915NTZ8_9BILA
MGFRLELIQSYKEIPSQMLTEICEMLFFRAILEFLNSVILNKKYKEFLKIEEKDKEIVKYLIDEFDFYAKFPEIFYSIDKKVRFGEIGKLGGILQEKIEKFIEDYIKNKLIGFIGRIVNNKKRKFVESP